MKSNIHKILTIIVVLVFLSVLLIIDKLKPINVSCICKDTSCDKNIDDYCTYFKTIPVRDFSKKAKKILSEDVSINNFIITSKYLNYEILIEYEQPVITLISSDNNIICQIDCMGNCMNKKVQDNLPVLVLPSDLYNADRGIKPEYKNTVSLLCNINNFTKINSSNINNNNFNILLKNGIHVIFPAQINDVQYMSGSLNLILSRLNNSDEDTNIIIDKNVSQIDFRFEHPILR